MKEQITQFLHKVKPLEAVLFGALGYVSGKFLTGTGFPVQLYNMNPTFKGIVDAANGVKPMGYQQTGKVIAGGIGTGALAKVLYDGFAGTVSQRDLSALIPFIVGVALDPEDQSSRFSSGSMNVAGGGVSRWS